MSDVHWCQMVEEQRWISTPWGEAHTYQSDEFACIPCVWGGLSIEESSDGRLLEMEGRGDLQYLIPYVRQLVFPQVPVEGWVIDMDKHHLLDGPGDAVCFPAYSGESVHTDGVSCRLAVMVNGGGGSKLFL